MKFTRKQRRLSMILAGLAVLAVAAGLSLYALSDAIVFFFTPAEAIARNLGPEVRFRLGGLVAEGSVKRNGAAVQFTVTDTEKSIQVAYTGQLPDLFREGQGVVAEGSLTRDGIFKADTVLAKHDETYMPKEVADALKKKGVWQGRGAQKP
ncbi:MAG TPA: cytochrome c maturation protein CcmE [Aestuariivirgaceae bacterium]|jgi:cytochrome c-type biogenesis protein CcmE